MGIFTSSNPIQGFRKKSDVNCSDMFASVACISTSRLLIALESIHNIFTHQMDVNTTFLNGELEDEVYMKQPEGFIMLDK